MSAAARDSTSHMGALDGLRGIAALVVAAAHAVSAAFVAVDLSTAVFVGIWARAAVIFFFVLSGYVIVASVLSSFAGGGFSIVRFALNRATRIYPPFLLALCLAWTVALLRGADVIPSIAPFIAEPLTTTWVALLRDLTFLFGAGTPMQNANAAVWSLRIEVACYAVVGLAALGARLPPRGRAAAAALALGLTALALWRFDSVALGFCSFGAGAAVAALSLGGSSRAAAIAWTAAAALGGAVCWEAIVGANPPSVILGIPFMVYQVVVILASAMLVAAIVRPKASPVRWPAAAAWLAPFSYTLFITHVPLMGLLIGAIGLPDSLVGRALFALAATLSATLFAAAAARVVERHEDLRRWLAAREPLRGLLAWEMRR